MFKNLSRRFSNINVARILWVPGHAPGRTKTFPSGGGRSNAKRTPRDFKKRERQQCETYALGRQQNQKKHQRETNASGRQINQKPNNAKRTRRAKRMRSSSPRLSVSGRGAGGSFQTGRGRAVGGPPTRTPQIIQFGPRRPPDPPRNVRLIGGIRSHLVSSKSNVIGPFFKPCFAFRHVRNCFWPVYPPI